MKQRALVVTVFMILATFISMQGGALASEDTGRTMIYEDESQRYWTEEKDRQTVLYGWTAELGEEMELWSGVSRVQVVNGFILCFMSASPTAPDRGDASVFRLDGHEPLFMSIGEDPLILENILQVGTIQGAPEDQNIFVAWELNKKVQIWFGYRRGIVTLNDCTNCFSHPEGYLYWTTSKRELRILNPSDSTPKEKTLGKVKKGSIHQGDSYLAWEDDKGQVWYWTKDLPMAVKAGSGKDAEYTPNDILLLGENGTLTLTPREEVPVYLESLKKVVLETSDYRFWTSPDGEDQTSLYYQATGSTEEKVINSPSQHVAATSIVDGYLLFFTKESDGIFSNGTSIVLFDANGTPTPANMIYGLTPEYAIHAGKFNQDDIYVLWKTKSKIHIWLSAKSGNQSQYTTIGNFSTCEVHPAGFFYLTNSKSELAVYDLAGEWVECSETVKDYYTRKNITQTYLAPDTVKLGKFKKGSITVGDNYLTWMDSKGQLCYWARGYQAVQNLGKVKEVEFFRESLILQEDDNLWEIKPGEGETAVRAPITEAELSQLQQNAALEAGENLKH